MWLCRSPRTVLSSGSVTDSLALRALATTPMALMSTGFSMLVLQAMISYSVRAGAGGPWEVREAGNSLRCLSWWPGRAASLEGSRPGEGK